MKKPLLIRSAIVCASLAAMAPRVHAQDRATASFEQLARFVRPGADITLIDRQGSELSGFITALTPVELTVFVDGARRTFKESDVLRIDQGRNDSLIDGALTGFGVGAGSALGMTLIAKAANYYIDGGKAARNVLAFGACGAGIGVLLDALHKTRTTVYDHTGRPPLFDYQVELSHQRKSVMVVLRF